MTLIRNRTRELTAYSAVSQPAELPRAPENLIFVDNRLAISDSWQEIMTVLVNKQDLWLKGWINFRQTPRATFQFHVTKNLHSKM